MANASSGDPSADAGPLGSISDRALFRTATEAAGEAILITTPDLEPPGPIIVYANPAFARMTGYAIEEAIGRSPRFLQGPETDRAVLDRLHTELAAGGPFRGETVNYRKDGSTYLINWLITPMHGATGRLTHWIAIQRDITELRQKEEQLRQAAEHKALLLGELQHRVRSTLAAVRSMVRRTGDTSQSAEDYAAHLDGRLNALTRVLSVIARDPAAGMDLESLVAEELLAYAAHEDGQATISGPEVLLRLRTAETFGLAVHELATNAVKYGALASSNGTVAVRWAIEQGRADGTPRLIFDWIESHPLRPVLVPRPRGFGMSMLEDVLPYELEAETTIALRPQGLSCRIVLPLTADCVRSVSETPGGPNRSGDVP